MTIESKIDALTKAIESLTAALIQKVQQPDVVVVESAPVATPVVVVEAPVEAPQPVAAPVVIEPTIVPIVSNSPVTATMPPLPSFEPPKVEKEKVAPFGDVKGMIEYVTAAYKSMGAEKGAKIQQVLVNMGVHNINDITTQEGFDDLYLGVEALKNGA